MKVFESYQDQLLKKYPYAIITKEKNNKGEYIINVNGNTAYKDSDTGKSYQRLENAYERWLQSRFKYIGKVINKRANKYDFDLNRFGQTLQKGDIEEIQQEIRRFKNREDEEVWEKIKKYIGREDVGIVHFFNSVKNK